MRQLPLFAYGTLRDATVRDFLLGDVIEHREEGTAQGRWVVADGTPAAVFGDGVEEIEGELLWIRPVSYDRALRQLDSYETPELYRRIEVRVTVGPELIEAFAYEWIGDEIAR